MAFGALKDLKIIDLTTRLSGPFGTMLFSDQGAEVIKVEPPKIGDMSRLVGPLDLKTPEGKEVLLTLLKDADAVVENFKQGTMEKLGLSYEYLQTINPKLVYGALRGFGDTRTQASPYAAYPSYDVIAQAMGGLMGISGPNAQTPVKAGPGLGDIIPGMLLGFGVLSAIHNARVTGKGQFVDVAMADSILYATERIVYQHDITKQVPQSTIAAPDDSFFENMCQALEATDLLEDKRFQSSTDRRTNRVALEERLNTITKKFTKQELLTLLGGKVPYGPVMKMDEIKANPHFQAREMIVPVELPELDATIDIAGVPIKMSDTPGKVQNRGPLHGEHTEEVLKAAGIEASLLQKVKRASFDFKSFFKKMGR